MSKNRAASNRIWILLIWHLVSKITSKVSNSRAFSLRFCLKDKCLAISKATVIWPVRHIQVRCLRIRCLEVCLKWKDLDSVKTTYKSMLNKFWMSKNMITIRRCTSKRKSTEALLPSWRPLLWFTLFLQSMTWLFTIQRWYVTLGSSGALASFGTGTVMNRRAFIRPS